MLLSIVMMIKNEEKYLDKTLNSLKNLMNEIESELIILDTGSTDSSMDICKKYTDKVYFAEWNNSFGDMRNISISYAKGEWILILDADEELVEYKKLVGFLKSKLHQNYNCASIELRNLSSEDKNKYINSYIVRLFRNSKDFKYVGAIHEQPLFKEPVYYNIASFNHYGYMFEDEELKQRKFKRNKELLFLELEKNPNNPYVYYQIGKTYIFLGDSKEAIYYMEKSYDIYKRLDDLPPYVYSGLAKIYLSLNKYKDCENICLEYIRNDDKNIDIYYYLAQSQQNLNKLKESLNNYERYIFLVGNYNISTQANNLRCESDTSYLIDNVIIEIIKIYYNLDDYKEVNKRSRNLNIKEKKKIYTIVINSLYKCGKLEEIKTLYNNTQDSLIEQNDFRISLESVLINIKEEDRLRFYKLLNGKNNNYEILNMIRVGKQIDLIDINKILREEKHAYYGDIIYYAIRENINIIDLLKGVDDISIENYFNYIVAYKRNSILSLYEFLINEPCCLSLDKLVIYKNLAKSLLIGSKLIDEKYEQIFLMYISYTYDYLKQIYNQNLTDNELLNYINDDDYKFVVSIMNIEKNKELDRLEYIRKMKKLLVENQQYKEVISILLNRFTEEFNESKEMKDLKQQYKNIIENSINNGELDKASKLIDEYKTISKEDVDIKNMQGIIHILKNEYNEAEITLKQAFLLDSDNANTLFNIAYLKELKKDYEEALLFYSKILTSSNDEVLISQINDKLRDLSSEKIVSI